MGRNLLRIAVVFLWGILLWAQPTGTARRLQRQVTVYHNGFASVVERYQVQLPQGQSIVFLTDLPSSVVPSSIHVQLSDGEARWYRFRPALHLDGKNIFEFLRGQAVRLISPDGQQVVEGTVVEVLPSHVLLRTPAGLLALPDPLRYQVLLEKEGSLLTQLSSAVQVLVQSQRGRESELTLSYFTEDIGWQMRYIAHLPAEGSRMSLHGFAALENRSSDALYDSSMFSLVAGTVARHEQDAVPPARAIMEQAEAIAASPPEPPTELMGFYRYDLPGPFTLHPREHLHLPLITRNEVRFWRLHQVRAHAGGSSTLPVFQILRIANTEEAGLGIPLPRGVIQFHARTSEGLSTFVGESALPETAIGDTITVNIGVSVDLKARQILHERRELAGNLVEESYRIIVLNGGREATDIEVFFHLRWEQQNWRITSSSHPYRRHDAMRVVFRVPVNARSESILQFTVQSQSPQR